LTFYQTAVNFVTNIFAVRANSKFQFVHAAVSKIHGSFPYRYYNINLRESLVLAVL